MKVETAAFLAKSRSFLVKAEIMAGDGLFDEAGRAAYLSGFHAAQALLVERIGRSPKTHSGVQTQFSRLARTVPELGEDERRFLGRGYNLKTIADYGTDPDVVVTEAQARDALAMARRFVDTIAGLLPAGDGAV